MTVDEKLLWKAYPEGALTMRGVTTVAGWVCRESQSRPGVFSWCRDTVFAVPPTSPRYGGMVRNPIAKRMEHSRRVARYLEERERGALLPEVDPRKDPATWACVLADLARTLGIIPSLAANEAVSGYSWCVKSGDNGGVIRWTLTVYVDDGRTETHSFPWCAIDTSDAAKAAVLARVSLREPAP